jgi:hypothetical protein
MVVSRVESGKIMLSGGMRVTPSSKRSRWEVKRSCCYNLVSGCKSTLLLEVDGELFLVLSLQFVREVMLEYTKLVILLVQDDDVSSRGWTMKVVRL